MRITLIAVAVAALCCIAASVAGGTVIQVDTPALLTSAISAVPDGGVIELAAGTYTSPVGGFQIINPGKSFTIRAASPGSAFLDGGGNNRVVIYRVTSPAARGWVSFEGLVFQNGFSNINTEAGGVTVKEGRATFTDCEFRLNSSVPVPLQGGVGGGVGIFSNSGAIFIRCTFTDNTSGTQGAAAVVSGTSYAFIHDSTFYRNRCNLIGHHQTSSGAALIVWASTVRVTNTRFEDNETGFSGGAINVKGPWDGTESDLVLANCTFINNRSEPHPTVTTPSPAVGGAIHIEDAAKARIFSSRFITNTAEFGGAISLYRGVVEIDDSVLRGNLATGNGTFGGRGGSIQAASNDTAGDGASNRRPSSITVRDSYIQGRYAAVDETSQLGGCIYATGDTSRMYGQGGVQQMGTLTDNRVTLDVLDSVLEDCDITEQVAGNSFGGAIYGGLMAATVDDSLIVASDASGGNGWGGGACFITESDVSFTGTTFSANTASVRGGGMYIAGSNVAVELCTFIGNEVSPGVSEPENQSYGAALFTTVQLASGLDITGLVKSSSFINDIGMPIYDDDRVDATGVFNLVQYNNNTFFNSSFGGRVLLNPVSGPTGHDVPGLNSLIVDRGNSNTTDKSPLGNNSAAVSEPVHGVILAVPPSIIDRAAVDDPEVATESFLAYAWSGGPATIDGQGASGSYGSMSADPGVHTLDVDGQQFDATITEAAVPETALEADPLAISSGETSQLIWSTTADSFIDSSIDWDVETQGAAAGAETIGPPETRTYRLSVTTEQGGSSSEATLWVDEPPPSHIFADGFESGDVTAWSGSSP